MGREHSFKISVLVFCVIWLCFSNQLLIRAGSTANLTFTEHIISTECDGALHACTIDIDLDGDIDIVTTTSEGDTISLWKNNDYEFTEQIIDDSFDEVIHIHAVDLDFDGDIDIMGGSQRGHELAWWKNENMVFTKQVLATNIIGAQSLYSGDIDKDGDLDLFSTSNDDISWWENDGQQTFTKHTLINRTAAFGRGFIRYIYAVDLDNDADIDFVSGENVWSASTGDDTIYYWLNDGNQVFTQKTVESVTYAQFHGFHVIDLDQDGDFDFCATSPTENQIDWFENDGQLNFAQHTITDTFEGANSVYPGDIDGDGDLDLIAAAYFDDKISWFENDGAQNFAEHVIREDFDGAQYCMLSDINHDGHYDVVGLAWEGDEFAWWEQTTRQGTVGVSSSAASLGIDIIIVSCMALSFAKCGRLYGCCFIKTQKEKN
ncbi:MAG: FG-GAP repeat domain-containing protein [Candidatus Hodarchaeales archaeon]